jgi:hypothetical protein
MKIRRAITILWLATTWPLVADDPGDIEKAAARLMPDVTWRVRSVAIGDFTCRGQKEAAILGFSASEIFISVFIGGIKARPEVLRYSRKARRADTAELTIESLDYDPKQDLGYELPGFQRSISCKGLNLSDGETDSAHIYWNRTTHRFDDWTL